MSSILLKIKSKYCLSKLFDFLPNTKILQIIKGNIKIFKALNFTVETYKKCCYTEKIKKLLKMPKQLYDISKFLIYLDLDPDQQSKEINEKNNINKEKKDILYESLNNVMYTFSLRIENKSWINVIKYINNIKLILSPETLIYMDLLNKDEKSKTLYYLKKYQNKINEIIFVNFKLDSLILSKILYILNGIFDIINDSYNIKKLNLKLNNISFEFFFKINAFISLNKIEELNFDIQSFNKDQIIKILYIPIQMISLKNLKINNFEFVEKKHIKDDWRLNKCLLFNKTYLNEQYIIYDRLFKNFGNHIESLDLSNSFCSMDLITLLNKYIFPLKELKIKLYYNDDIINWHFLEYNINTIEVLEIEIKENNNEKKINNLINILNNMKKIKHLKIKVGIELKQLLLFLNVKNIEYFNIDFILPFGNLKTLIIEQRIANEWLLSTKKVLHILV